LARALAPMLLAVALSGCRADGPAPGSSAGGPPAGTAPPSPARDHAVDEAAAEATDRAASESPWAARYYDGYLAETLDGDIAAARTAYEEVLAGAGASEPEAAARAALRLAYLEGMTGSRRRAADLLARAAVLGSDDPALVEQSDRLRVDLGIGLGLGIGGIGSLAAGPGDPGNVAEVRGPPIGTHLDGVDQATGAAFDVAEQALAVYHRLTLRPRLEELTAGIRAKERAMDEAVRAYRAVLGNGDSGAAPASDAPVLAQVAVELRIGSLYHDLAVALVFDLPPELETGAAARIRRNLRGTAINYLRKAAAAYRRAVAAGGTGAPVAAERWVNAARLGERSVAELLGE
jgi:hypothetical protein